MGLHASLLMILRMIAFLFVLIIPPVASADSYWPYWEGWYPGDIVRGKINVPGFGYIDVTYHGNIYYPSPVIGHHGSDPASFTFSQPVVNPIMWIRGATPEFFRFLFSVPFIILSYVPNPDCTSCYFNQLPGNVLEGETCGGVGMIQFLGTYESINFHETTDNFYQEINIGIEGVSVPNVPPAVGPITAPINPQLVNTEVTANANFIDPGILDTHAAMWNWGDGSSSAGTISEANGAGSATGSHAYSAPGVYRVGLTITDNDGGTGQSFFEYIVVYDPSAGFVTGGGWIDSPPGAYTPSPFLTGKATFGFISKYQKGANVPTGNTQFKFHAIGMDFKSTTYQWMIIAGAKAKYKGEGRINDSGLYDFMLTAIDGELLGTGGQDKFRMKILDKATGQIIYDNQMGADDNSDDSIAILGGSIVIHK